MYAPKTTVAEELLEADGIHDEIEALKHTNGNYMLYSGTLELIVRYWLGILQGKGRYRLESEP